jgi:pimeloyl-ACP methyl ester carboxylesterase
MKTTLSKDGTKLAYDVYGSGPALIYITGATCFRSFEMVLRDAKVLAREFTVYNYDRRGRGDSGDTLPYAPEREVEDIAALIEAAGGTAYLYGHSSGAILALEAAMRLGNKVSKLVMYDPAYVDNLAYQQEFKQLSQGLYELLDNGKNEEAISGFLAGIGIPTDAIDWMQQSADWPTMVALAPTLAYDTMLASDLPPIERAAQLAIPTQIIVGADSPASIHAGAQQLAEAIPGATHNTLAGQDHMPDPEALLPVIAGFLK